MEDCCDLTSFLVENSHILQAKPIWLIIPSKNCQNAVLSFSDFAKLVIKKGSTHCPMIAI